MLEFKVIRDKEDIKVCYYKLGSYYSNTYGLQINGEKVVESNLRGWFKTSYPIVKVEERERNYDNDIYVTNYPSFAKQELTREEWEGLEDGIKDFYELKGEVEYRYKPVEYNVEEINGEFNIVPKEIDVSILTQIKYPEELWGNYTCKINQEELWKRVVKVCKDYVEYIRNKKGVRINIEEYSGRICIFRVNSYSKEEVRILTIKENSLPQIKGENYQGLLINIEEFMVRIIKKVEDNIGETCEKCNGKGFIPLHAKVGEEESLVPILDIINKEMVVRIDNFIGYLRISEKNKDRISQKLYEYQREIINKYEGGVKKKLDISLSNSKE